MLLIPIFNNISLLVTLSVAYILVIRYFDQSSRWIQFFSGLLFGGFIILGIFNAVELMPGLIFDGRSIILAVAGLFGGPITAIVAAIMALAYRIHIGGPGMIMGVLVIIEATTLGIIFRYLIQRTSKLSPFVYYGLLGFMVHLIMLILLVAVPGEVREDLFKTLAFPVLILYPLGTFLICSLFHAQKHYLHTVKKLSESEERFRQLFFESQMVLLVIDPESGYLQDANKTAETFYNYSRNQLLSMKISQINMYKEDELKQKMGLALEKKQKNFRMQHRVASGEVRDVEVFAGPVNFGGKTYLYSIVNDITENLQAINKLKESDLSYRSLFNAVNDAIYIQDREGKFLDINNGAMKMYGYKREDFIGNTPEFLSAPGMNDLDRLKVNLEKAFEGKEPGFEFWGIKKDGTVFPKYVRMFKTQYFGQDVVLVLANDITERKMAQKALEESRFNLSALINVSEDVLLLLDNEGKILLFNKAFTSYYQKEKNPEGKNLFELLPKDISSQRKKYFQNILETRKSISFEDCNFDKDWWITYYPILDKQANVSRVAVYARDITTQRKLLNLQKNLQVAENSAQLKQQFLSNMSHEMRTPMNGIIGMTKLMWNTPLTAQQKDFLHTIEESSKSLLSLINDVLDLARFESGKMPAYPEQVMLDDIKDKINKLFRQSALNKGLEFTVIFDDTLPEFIVTDERRLMQVIINLVGNAIKFTPSGKITVSCKPEKNKGKKHIIRFTVEDTGIGVSKEFISSIFDEFAQLDNSKTRNYDGSGLGLAISKKIIEMLGGEIGVTSTEGKGSKFWFTLKMGNIKKGTIRREKPTQVQHFENLHLRILLVEDKIINRKVAELILKNMGCEVEIAENGLEGVKKVSENDYDVVLMDIQMPVMDGISAVKMIRSSGIKQPYIIGLSAEAMEGDAEKYIAEGMDDYLTKPLIPVLLYEKLLPIKNGKNS